MRETRDEPIGTGPPGGRETGLAPAAADAAVRAALEAVSGALAWGEAVRFAGFGAPPARPGRNPAIGAPIAVPGSWSVSFRAGKGLRDAVNRATG